MLVDEPGTSETQATLSEATLVATSEISYVEARAAIARMRASGRIGTRESQSARQLLDDIWLDLLAVPPDDELLATAADLADAHSLRGYDSVQLAAATMLQAADDVKFACWDIELRTAAERLGLAVA